jgi:hypothetical protein
MRLKFKPDNGKHDYEARLTRRQREKDRRYDQGDDHKEDDEIAMKQGEREVQTEMKDGKGRK